MQTLQTTCFFFTFPSPKPLRLLKPHKVKLPFFNLSTPSIPHLTLHCFSSDEYPVGDDDAFLQAFGPKEKESEEEARRKNWVDRGWAPWEEILSPEAKFARLSLNEGEEVALQSPEAIQAFKMLSPNYRKKKIEEMGITEDEYYAKQFEIKGEIPEPLGETMWAGPLVVSHVPPRDWPPRGWEVDRKELEFIREAHKMMAVRVDYDNVEEMVKTETDQMNLERYKVFLKQYNEWVAANKDRLEEESYKVKGNFRIVYGDIP